MKQRSVRLAGPRLEPRGVVAALLMLTCLLTLGGPAAAQEKEEGRKLDESGLTNLFVQLNRMTRSTATADVGGAEVVIHTPRLPPMTIDYQNLDKGEVGVVQFFVSAAIKLRLEAPVEIGGAILEPGNITSDFAGLYSVWIERLEGDQWQLRFNEEPDAWGTQHDPKADVATAPLTFASIDGGRAPLGVELDLEEGSLVFRWGAYQWSTTARAAQAAAAH